MKFQCNRFLGILVVMLCVLPIAADGGEPEISFFGSNRFRASGWHVKAMFATQDKAFVYTGDRRIKIFYLESGNPVADIDLQIPANAFIADADLSKSGKEFAVAAGRKIEIRKTDSPDQIIKTLDLPAINATDADYVSSANIEFSDSGEQLLAFDQETKTLLSFDVASGKSTVILRNPGVYVDDLRTMKNGDTFLLSSDALLRVAGNGKLSRCAVAIQGETFRAIAVTDSSIYLSRVRRSGSILEGVESLSVVELGANDFKQKAAWDCSSSALAIQNDHPVFQKSNVFVEGLPYGRTERLLPASAQPRYKYKSSGSFSGTWPSNQEFDSSRLNFASSSPSEIEAFNKLIISADGDYFLVPVGGGLLCWNAKSGKPADSNRQPRQRDATFAVDDNGKLTALTASQVFQSSDDGKLVETRAFSSALSPVTAYRSLSSDGTSLAYVDRKTGAYVLDLVKAGSEPIKFKLPNNARPDGVYLSKSGKSVAIRFDPKVLLGDLAGENKRQKGAFSKALAEGFFGPTPGARLDQSCAILTLPSGDITAIGKIGSNALMSSGKSPFLSEKEQSVYWVGPKKVGRWDFGDSNSKVKTRRTAPGESIGFCTFNRRGDIVFREMDPNDPKDVVAKVYWLPFDKRRPILLETEMRAGEENCVAALTDDGQFVYVGKSTGCSATISKLKLPEQEIVWKVDLPSRVERIRLSPNSKVMGVKLGDSRYAVLNDIE